MNTVLAERRSPAARPAQADDLSALTWVHAELRRSLEAAHKALRRHLKEAAAIGHSDVDTVDPAVLRTARATLHQGVGALEMIGLQAAAQVLRGSETAVQRMVGKPSLVTPQAVEAIERSSFALLDFLGRQLAGKTVSPLLLFPAYRATQQLAGADRVHPADLWTTPWQWREVQPDRSAQPRRADDTARGEMEALVLALMRQPTASALSRMSDFCADLAAGAAASMAPDSAHLSTFWQLAAAMFEAQAVGLLGSDVYVKRIASRLLAQLRMGARGQPALSDRLAQDMLFFCMHAAAPTAEHPAPRLTAVRRTWRLDREISADYEATSLGRFDPSVVALARKRVAGAKEAWSAVAGGDVHRLAALSEVFALVGDSTQRLFPRGERLADALHAAGARTAAGGAEPPPALAMEVATSLLYLDASIEDADFDHPELGLRVERLAERIEAVCAGADPLPLEPWMEELYRRVSDRQTMGSVVQELRVSLSDVEKRIDQFFRQPADRDVLIPVPAQLNAMRGVLSVLGLAQASQAVLHMRDDVDALAQADAGPQGAAHAGTFERVADNLGALSFLIDMLSVQPSLAKALFRFDAGSGVLSAVMGQPARSSVLGVLDDGGPVPAVELSLQPARPLHPPLPDLPLADQVQQLAAALADRGLPDDDVLQRLDRLAQQALAADEPELARTLGGARVALRTAGDAATRHALRDELASGLQALAPAGLMELAPAPQPAVPAASAAGAGTAAAPAADDAEMRDIFLEEAREVLADSHAALQRLSDASDGAADMTALRRAFHTLKGSSRMVGLNDFGEAAWSCEQLYNNRLAAQPVQMDAPLRAFTAAALRYMAEWTEAIAAGPAAAAPAEPHHSADVVVAADSLRLHGTLLPIALRGAGVPADTADALQDRGHDNPAAPSQAPADAPGPADLSARGPVPSDWPVAAPVPFPEPGHGVTPVALDGLHPGLNIDAFVSMRPAAAPPLDAANDLASRVPGLPSADDLDLSAPAPAAGQPAFEIDMARLDDVPAADAAALPGEDGLTLDLTALEDEAASARRPLGPPAPETKAAADALMAALVSGWDPLDMPALAPDTPPAAPPAPVQLLVPAQAGEPEPEPAQGLEPGALSEAAPGPELVPEPAPAAETAPASEPTLDAASASDVAPSPVAPVPVVPIAEPGSETGQQAGAEPVAGPVVSGESAEFTLERVPQTDAWSAFEPGSASDSAFLSEPGAEPIAEPVGKPVAAMAPEAVNEPGFGPEFEAVGESGSESATEPATGPLAEPVAGSTGLAAAESVSGLSSAPSPETAAEPQRAPEPEVRVVGHLHIGIPLFNIFLNEADELSRRLGTELAVWGMDPERPVMPDSTIALAHSLAGNSATVGYHELSALGRALEHALMRSQAGGAPRDGEPELFNDAAEEVRRLLHQFAAGFLRPVSPALMERLAEHERLEPRAEPAPLPSLRPEWEAAPASEPAPAPEAPPAAAVLAGPAAATLFAPSFSALDDTPAAPPAAPQARPDAFDDDQDIDAQDSIDPELFPIFEEEAEELLPQLQARLRDWVSHPGDIDAASACMRTLHTFKGGARLAGAMRLGEMAHRLETAIEHLVARQPVQGDDVEPLLARADSMATAFAVLCDPSFVPEAPTPAPLAQPQALHAVAPASEPATVPPAAAAATSPADDSPELAAPAAPAPAVEAHGIAAWADDIPAPGAPHASPAPVSEPANTGAAQVDWARFAGTDAAPAAAERATGGGAVRVRAGLLDRMVNQAGEMSITRARIDADVRQLQASLGELTDSLERMRKQLHDIELQAETQISSRMEAAKAAAQAFDPLEMDRFTRFQELTRFMAESVNDVATLQRSLQRTLQSTEDELAAQARLTRGLQDDLLRTRMVEFESLADRLYRTVRQAAKETGKQVRLDITGGAIEVDRGVLERMVGPFEHLLRNSVVHGIENTERRLQSGKPADGRIGVQVSQNGNEVAIEFGDDGAGLDLQRIHQRGVERGLLQPGQSVSDAELSQLIFAPGFSTADSVTELAGRGVGMDVVRTEVNAMGGRIEVASTAGQGTRLRLLLPLTTAVTQVVMLRCGVRSVAVPSTLVDVVRRVGAPQIAAAYASGSYEFGDGPVPFFWLAALLEPGARGDTGGRSQNVVIVRSASQRVALHVDEIVGNQEVVVKNVGPQLARLPGLVGVTLLPSGAVSLIYNPVALAALYGDAARRLPPAEAAQGDAGSEPPAALPAAERRVPLVLVVDDSLTVRRVTQRLLQREGYRVALAKDGLDALERLAEERPVVLLSDIEMPRMDGFDLLRNVRADERLAGLPVVMITSRIAQKHHDYAVELGVDHYLGKPYSEELLLSLVARYAGADRPAAPAR